MCLLGLGGGGGERGSKYGFGEWGVQRTKLVDETLEKLLELLEELTIVRSSIFWGWGEAGIGLGNRGCRGPN